MDEEGSRQEKHEEQVGNGLFMSLMFLLSKIRNSVRRRVTLATLAF